MLFWDRRRRRRRTATTLKKEKEEKDEKIRTSRKRHTATVTPKAPPATAAGRQGQQRPAKKRRGERSFTFKLGTSPEPSGKMSKRLFCPVHHFPSSPPTGKAKHSRQSLPKRRFGHNASRRDRLQRRRSEVALSGRRSLQKVNRGA